MSTFTPIASTLGGVLLGAAAALLFALNGRIAGISGIAAGVTARAPAERSWRLFFLGGMLAGAGVLYALSPGSFGRGDSPGLGTLALAGVLVGYGTRLGNGCTSGHGICGLARRSPRSLVATATFMAVAAVVVFLVRHVAGAMAMVRA